MDENIIIPINIDKSPALAQLEKLGKEAISKPLVIPIKTNDVSATFLKNSSAIDQTSNSLKRIIPGANQADNALLNLNRVVQDAPYGFIGISNNINPLLESFQRLRRETGSSQGAIKALAGGLMGGGGLGLAIAAITTSISFASIGFDRWTQKKMEAKAATDELKVTEKELAEIVKNSYGETAKQVSKLNELVAVVNNTSQGTNQRRAALAELQKIYPSYFAGLGLEIANTSKLSGIVAQLTENLKLASRARVLSRQMDLYTEKQMKAEDEHNKNQVAYNQAVRDYRVASAKASKETADMDSRSAAYARATNAELKAAATFMRETKSAAVGAAGAKISADKELAKLDQQLQDVKKNMGSLDVGGDDLAAGFKNASSELKNVSNELNNVIEKLNRARDARKFDLMGQRASFGLYEQLSQWREQETPKVNEEWKKINNALFTGPQISASVPEWLKNYISGVQKGFDEAKFQAAQLSQEYANIAGQAVGGALVAIGAGLGNALAGTGSIADIFKGVGNILGDALIQFGTKMIMASAVVKAAMNALESVAGLGVAGVAAGIALVAVGTYIKSSLNKSAGAKIGGFADGGGSYGPMLTWFGESPRTSRSNPELAMRKDQMLAAVDGAVRNSINQGKGLGNGRETVAVLEGDVVFEISGDKLLGILNRTQQRHNRNF